MIIALSAWKGSGKDAMAKILVEKYGFKRVAFADVLKDMVAEQYGIDRTSLDDPERKESPILSMPVESKDRFSEMIHRFMRGEFRGAHGERPGESGADPLYWTPRALAILEGSVKRSANSQYWVQRALSQIKPGERVVITDMRYRSEAEQIKEHAKLAGVRMNTLRIDRFDASPSLDPSERDLDAYDFDFYLINKSSLQEFENNIDSFVKEFV